MSDPEAVYPVSRRFRQEAGSRVSAPWPAAAGSFGPRASEGQCYHCPVSYPIPVKNPALTNGAAELRKEDGNPFTHCPSRQNNPKRSNFIEFYANRLRPRDAIGHPSRFQLANAKECSKVGTGF